jgi:leucyl aminopeptidase (aminopeptidase T)
MSDERSAWNGARKIIDTCLGLTAGQELLVLFDETSWDVAHILMQVAYRIDVHASANYVPVSIQAQLGTRAELPLTIMSAMREAVGILTCVTDDQACLPFRARIFDVGLDRRSKIGHMPGVTVEILPMADVDYNEISTHCEVLAAGLLKGRELELTSYDSQEKPASLTVEMGGWARSPTISNGLIQRGGWANIPPGEAFIAPLEWTAQGTVIVNGSLPGYVIPHGGEVWLEFESGRLVEYHSRDPHCLEIMGNLKGFALQKGDANWNVLAEVGLGVNPAVEPLTGIELLDEKKYGTAHIALGENDWFGGSVSSAIHSDLTILRPTVRIDGLTVVDGGEIRTGWADWQEDHQEIELEPTWRSGFSIVSRTGTRGEHSGGVLKREWISGRGDVHLLQVGQPTSARKAAYLYAQIPPFDRRIEIASLLAHNPDLDDIEVYQLIRLMQKYELVQLS